MFKTQLFSQVNLKADKELLNMSSIFFKHFCIRPRNIISTYLFFKIMFSLFFDKAAVWPIGQLTDNLRLILYDLSNLRIGKDTNFTYTIICIGVWSLFRK